ncbi:M23 family metallopeptidase [Thalassotalea litorea]|uniref:M23 family metallopeptidase n=1 Tax=Thalassotalea litorea TaxID=2020715 RepID=UPI00373669DB
MKYTALQILAFAFMMTEALAEDTVKIHAPVTESFNCTEHWDGQLKSLGDALGTDCVVQEFHQENGRMFMRSFKGEGFNNKDWYGYGKSVLAPCDCEVVKVFTNAVTNLPGIMIPGMASHIIFEKPDGTNIVIAHVADIKVSKGDKVKAGESVATIGNNGYSRNPHLHIAAWQNDTPMQIRFDQKTIDLQGRNNY